MVQRAAEGEICKGVVRVIFNQWSIFHEQKDTMQHEPVEATQADACLVESPLKVGLYGNVLVHFFKPKYQGLFRTLLQPPTCDCHPLQSIGCGSQSQLSDNYISPIHMLASCMFVTFFPFFRCALGYISKKNKLMWRGRGSGLKKRRWITPNLPWKQLAKSNQQKPSFSDSFNGTKCLQLQLIHVL